MEGHLDNCAPIARGRYIPQKNGKVKRFDSRVERFVYLAVLSMKKNEIARCEQRRRTRIANSGRVFNGPAVLGKP
jgi:hypothetical protein